MNEELAKAILKRPESIRSPVSSSSSGPRSESVVGRASATKDSFTFASLSDLGNSQPSFQGIDTDSENGPHSQYEEARSHGPDSLSDDCQ